MWTKIISIHLRYTERPDRCDWAAADMTTHKGLNLKDSILVSEISGLRSLIGCVTLVHLYYLTSPSTSVLIQGYCEEQPQHRSWC